VTARNRVMRTLMGEQEGLPFLAVAEALAPRLVDCSYAEMTADSNNWVSGVQQAAKLLTADAVCIGFDSQLAVEACRANASEPETAAPMAVLFEAAERLFAVQRNNIACVLAVAGPATLAAQLTSGLTQREAMAAVKPQATRLVEAASRLRPDMIVFVEAEGVLTTQPSPELRRLYATLGKVIAHYGIVSGIQAPGAQGLETLGCNVLFCDASAPLPTEAWDALVVALPPQPAEAEAIAKNLVTGRGQRRPAIAVGIQGITRTADLEHLRSIRATLATLVP